MSKISLAPGGWPYMKRMVNKQKGKNKAKTLNTCLGEGACSTTRIGIVMKICFADSTCNAFWKYNFPSLHQTPHGTVESEAPCDCVYKTRAHIRFQKVVDTFQQSVFLRHYMTNTTKQQPTYQLFSCENRCCLSETRLGQWEAWDSHHLLLTEGHLLIDRNPTPTIKYPVFTEARTLYLQRTPSLRLPSTMLCTGNGQLGSNLTGGRHYGSSAWGISPSLPSDGWRVLPADLQVYPPIWRAGGRLANTLVNIAHSWDSPCLVPTGKLLGANGEYLGENWLP